MSAVSYGNGIHVMRALHGRREQIRGEEEESKQADKLSTLLLKSTITK